MSGSTIASTLGGWVARLRARVIEVCPPARDAPAAVVGLVCLPFLIPLAQNEIRQPLFGDQLVFQYTGWCIRKGLKLYRDVGMCDGPLIHFLHAAIQAFVGMSDRAFREADLVLQAFGSGAMGFLLADRRTLSGLRSVLSSLAWASASMAIWLSWYLTLGWDTAAQRETFYMLFGSVGLVLLYAGAQYSPKASAVATFVGAFLVTILPFGKPTGVAYVFIGALTVLLADESAATRATRLKMALYGAAAAVATFAVLLAAFGSFRWYFFWCVVMPYRGNAYIFRLDWRWLFLTANPTERRDAFVAIVAGVAAIVARLVPRRALGLALLPALIFTGACLQARGYIYQFMPTNAAELVLLLVVLTELGKARVLPARYRPILAGVALWFAAVQAFDHASTSPFLYSTVSAPTSVFCPAERKVGELVKARTKPSDRVFVYGGNGHVLLLAAERLTASPFIHPFWLDPVSMIPQSFVKPDAAHLIALEDMVRQTRARTCEAVQANEPASVVSDNMDVVFQICPPLKGLLAASYDLVSTDGFSVYFKRPDASSARVTGAGNPAL